MKKESDVSKIIEDLNSHGISSANVNEILDESEMKYFEEILTFYSDSLINPRVKKRIREINNHSKQVNTKYKNYEITHDVCLNEPLNFDNLPLIQLYTSKNILKIAKGYLGNSLKLRNPLAWIHPSSKQKKEIRSQRWHRDQEDYKMLKVFVLFSNVNENNGPTQYIKETNASGKHKNIAPNMTYTKDHWSNKNRLLRKVYSYIREKIPYNYMLPKNNIVKATGKVGTIFFIDTNGLHKGGQVKDGIRLLTHCNYLRESAPMLKKGMPLEKLNSDQKLFNINYNSKTFKSFDSDIQKMLI